MCCVEFKVILAAVVDGLSADELCREGRGDAVVWNDDFLAVFLNLKRIDGEVIRF